MLTPTVVPTPWWARMLIWICLPAVGAGLVLLVVRVLVLLALPGWIGFLGDLPDGWATVGALVLGTVLGLAFAGLVDRESLTVRLTTTEVELVRPGVFRVVPRGEVSVAFRDADQLVLLGHTGRELAREPSHVAARKMQAAFTAHGIAWASQDPYTDAYSRWVPDLPGLPNAVFAARQKALDHGDEGDQRELREELGRLGYVIRDRRKKQYWRRAGG